MLKNAVKISALSHELTWKMLEMADLLEHLFTVD